ncbi:hypothetical protein FE783_31735 [Paenibacillus mesophilus]|uniref:DUF6807 domain-containing protein n=1 Tax=Paenibacillus mesophilus TaxID=2582849 RepID=UPI00110DA80F|nr:PmoA family protein [Paenibacillus mesophilus]TMV44730.1 hypothetical protein FE783_31735 [Paenibacillus mesophilus]
MTTLFKLKVSAGSHHREHCPVSFRLLADSPLLQGNGAADLGMLGPDGEPVALQCREEEGFIVLHWIIRRASPGDQPEFTVRTGISIQTKAEEGIQLVEKENRIDIVAQGRLFTSYVFDPLLAKPYIGPILGPDGESFTRLDFETKEHPHHRSLWLAIGDVNDIDFWNERADRYGKQVLAELSEKTDGPVMARLTSTQNWCSHGGKAQLSETRTMTFYNTTENGRLIDLDFEIRADKDRVEFGATKEAGPLGIRVAESMKADNGGTIVNAFGSVGEKECWGQRAPWCDYYGKAGGRTLGIAAFDHPDNEDFPTYWHVRDYGLLAANNLYFSGGKLFRKGESIRYRHRVYFHEGDTAAGKVADKYQDYIHPPQVSLLQP